jgi:hypothetical protein
LTSEDLRADALHRLLKIELENSQNPKLLEAAKIGLVEMVEEFDKVQFHDELKHSLKILSVYLETGDWSVILPNGSGSKAYSNNLNEIQSLIKKSVLSNENNELN